MAEGREQRAARQISEMLASPATRNWVKTTLELALLRDPAEVARDAKLLSKVLDEWSASVLEVSIANCERTVSSIERILAAHEHSEWLRTALRLALHRDPVDAANDADALSALLQERCAVIGAAACADVNGDCSHRGQLPLPLPHEAT